MDIYIYIYDVYVFGFRFILRRACIVRGGYFFAGWGIWVLVVVVRRFRGPYAPIR